MKKGRKKVRQCNARDNEKLLFFAKNMKCSTILRHPKKEYDSSTDG